MPRQLAAEILTGQGLAQECHRRRHQLHAVSVSPTGPDTLEKTTQIGNHIFYRGSASHSRDS